jgi:TonB family protein
MMHIIPAHVLSLLILSSGHQPAECAAGHIAPLRTPPLASYVSSLRDANAAGAALTETIDTAAIRKRLRYPAREKQRGVNGGATAIVVIQKGSMEVISFSGSAVVFVAELQKALAGLHVISGTPDQKLTVDVQFISTPIESKPGEYRSDFAIAIVPAGLDTIEAEEGFGNGSALARGLGSSEPSELQGSIKQKDEEEPDPDVFIPVEKDPTYDGAALQRRVRYPDVARRNGIEGTVVVRVLVGKDGRVRRTMIESGNIAEMNDAAVEAIKGTMFTPALQDGKPIDIWIQIPVMFKFAD